MRVLGACALRPQGSQTLKVWAESRNSSDVPAPQIDTASTQRHRHDPQPDAETCARTGRRPRRRCRDRFGRRSRWMAAGVAVDGRRGQLELSSLSGTAVVSRIRGHDGGRRRRPLRLGRAPGLSRLRRHQTARVSSASGVALASRAVSPCAGTAVPSAGADVSATWASSSPPAVGVPARESRSGQGRSGRRGAVVGVAGTDVAVGTTTSPVKVTLPSTVVTGSIELWYR